MSYGGRIAILPGQSKAEEFSTLVHETAHELLHKAERRTATTKTVRETEAESVAFVVGKAVGLVTGNRVRRLHPSVPRQCILAGRIAGSHPEDGGGHSCCVRAAHRASGERIRHRSPGTCGGSGMKTILAILQKPGGWRPNLYVRIENQPYLRW